VELSKTTSVNLGFIVDKKASIHPERTAITDMTQGESYTYGSLSDRSNRCASKLIALGVSRGDAVCVLSGNRIECFDILIACAKTGGIFVPINFRLSKKEIAEIVSDSGAPVVFYDNTFSSLLEEVDSDTVTLCDIESTASVSDVGLWNNWDYGTAEDVLALIYTSGSSGKPKGVIQTHGNAFFKSIDSIIDWEMTAKDVILVMAPLFHVAGLNALTISGLHLGAQLVLQNRFDAEGALEVIEDKCVTCFAVVPTILRMIVNAPSFQKRELRSLRFFLVGGERLDASLQKAFLEKGAEALNVFGMSETTDGAIYQRPGENITSGSIGRIATHVEARLVTSQMKEVPVGEVGELTIGGPTVSPGYWKAPEKTKEAFVDGWVLTGDLAYKDANGDFFMVGRSDNIIKSGAEKISPAEIERAILTNERVADVVVFGIPDPKWGQSPKAVVACKNGFELTEAEILETCRTKLAGYKKPRSIVIVKEFPRTGSGKIDRSLIKKTYG